MAARTSPRYLLQILEALAFMFQMLPTLQVTAGGTLTQHVTYTQGQPMISNSDLGNVVLTFYSAGTGNTVRAGTTNIGTPGNQLMLSDILSVAFDQANSRFTLTIDTTGLEVNTTEDVHFELSVVQPDP